MRILIGVVSAIVLSVSAYLFILAGAFVSSEYEAKAVGMMLSVPGYIFIAPGLLGVDLPMYLIFPKGGASGVFGSILLNAIIFWSVLLSFLSFKRYWPFKTSTKKLKQ